jgi:hypothetical protein
VTLLYLSYICFILYSIYTILAGYNRLVKQINSRDSAVSAIIEESRGWKRREEAGKELGEHFGGKKGKEQEEKRSK